MKKKIYKALSILLTLAILVSTCVCSIGTVFAKEATYYVSATAGETKNGSEENPFSTVAEAILFANEQEYGEGDTVTVKIVDTDATDTTYVQWGGGEVIEYNYKLYVTSDVAGTIVDISNSAHLYGETDISKITLKVSNGYPNVYLYNQNQTIMNGAAMTSRNLLLGGYTKGDVEINHDVNVNLCIANAIILGSTYKNAVYNKNINITYDTTGAPTILPGGDSNSITTTYNSNININFKNAKGVTFKNRSGTIVYGANAAVQVINSTGVAAITAEAEPFLSATKTDGKPLPRWTITNNSSYKDAITFTDTAGVYNIDKTLCAEATDSYGDIVAEATLVNEDDQYKTLDLRSFGAGEYTVDIFTERKTATYYVSSSATDDTAAGTTSETAKLTIAGAIEQATKDGLSTGDTVTVKIVGTVNWGVENKEYPYDYNLVVTSDETGAIVNIAHHKLSGNKNKFDNVKINITNSNDLFFCYTDVTTTSSVTIGSRNWIIGNHYGTTTVDHKINLDFNSKTNMMVLGSTGGNSTINKDININYNYASGAPDLRLGVNNGNSSTTTTYNANINLNLKNATGASFKYRAGNIVFGDNAAIQVINSTGNEVTFDTGLSAYLKYTSDGTRAGAALDIWNITNNSGYKNAITFSNTAGVYKIDKTMNASVTNSSGEVIEATLVNDYDNFKTLDLRSFGVGAYNVDIQTAPREVTYYVSAAEIETRDGTKDYPFETVEEANIYATEAGYGKNDTVTVKILGNEQVTWGTKHVEYNYKLIVTSEEESAQLYMDATRLTGETDISNVTIKMDGGNIFFYNKNQNILNNVTMNSRNLILGGYGNGDTEINHDININLGIAQMFILGNTGLDTTYNNDINITYDTTKAPTIRMGSDSSGKITTYNGNVNFNFKNATGINLGNRSGTIVYGANSAVQVINSTGVATITAEAEPFLSATKSDGNALPRWTINNATGDKDALSFVSGVAGKYKINIDTKVYDVKVFDASGNEITASVVKDGCIDIAGAGFAAGTYTVMVEEAELHDYDEYINYRNGLGNTYSKLTNDKKLNVVYFGGSVTAGTGSSDNEVYSWRARIGNWLKTNFPAANVTNYKQAIGETGTYLGCYRVAKDVISKAPDLLFIEYSINDYYDSARYDRAQMQFETIVREVKTAYPNCDIVTILVTNYGTVENARNNIMHKEAQGHEDICKAYNIPSIYVGGALGDALGKTWTAKENYQDDDVWTKYVADSVHPNDAGYEIYYNVIKEFLNNELKHREYDGTIKTNPMPEIQNKYKYLFDGDITYIDEGDTTKVTYDTTNEGITYEPDKNPGIVSKDDYCGILYVKSGFDSTISVKFTGTELVMLACLGYDKTNEYQVSVDGGETWKTMQYTDKNPVVIATGLESGEHTALIKPASNNQVGITGFFSRDVEKSTNILNIADLVNADEKITANTTEAYFDYNNDDVIDAKDIATVRKILLNNK